MIRCKLCNKLFHVIGWSHLQEEHGLSMKEYRCRFPQAKFISNKVRAKIAQATTKQMKDPEQRARAAATLNDPANRAKANRKRRTVQSRRAASERTRKRMANPKARKLLSKSTKKQMSTPKARERSRRTMQRLRADPHWMEKSKEANLEFLQELWDDPSFRKRHRKALKKMWNAPGFKQKRADKVSKQSKERWKDPDFRDRVRGRRKWYKPELACKQLLVELGLWGPDAQGVRFYDHKDIPRQVDRPGKGWSFNADFATKCGLIIHVDGWYHYSSTAPQYEWRKQRDATIDRWCIKHGYLFLRLTDVDIYQHPGWCKRMIRRLVRGHIVPLVPSKC